MMGKHYKTVAAFTLLIAVTFLLKAVGGFTQETVDLLWPSLLALMALVMLVK